MIVLMHSTITALQSHLLHVVLLRPQLSLLQQLTSQRRISWNELNLEIPGDRDQRTLELVVVYVVGIWRVFFTRHDLVAGEETKKRGVEETRSDELSRACARSCTETQMLQSRCFLFSGRIEGFEPALWVEFSGVRAEVVHVYRGSWLVGDLCLCLGLKNSP